MTSQERHELRYQNRKRKREAKRKERSLALGSLEDIFRNRKMFMYGMKCCVGVTWKQSTQNFKLHLFSITAVQCEKIKKNEWRQSEGFHFILKERGKARPIDAPPIRDRQIQKTFNYEYLLPLYQPGMIYENGASMKGKGLSFHFDMIKKHLHEIYRKYGREWVIRTNDYSQFFPSASHKTILDRHDYYIFDEDMKSLANGMIEAMGKNGCGVNLGVEVSQTEMVAFPSKIDNWLKCQVGLEFSSHYMDDYLAAHESKEKAKEVDAEFIKKSEAIGLHVNKSKSRIVLLTKPFKFCKATFILTESGKVIVHGNRDSFTRAARKMKSLARKYREGEIELSAIDTSIQCSIGYFENYNDHARVLKLKRLYHWLFVEGGYKIV